MTKKQQAGAPGQAPAEVLTAYMREMNQWETRAWERMEALKDQDSQILAFFEEVQAQLNEISARYCTVKKRKYGRQGSVGSPPAYDPETEKIIEVVSESATRVVIDTRQTTPGHLRHRYVLLRTAGQWRLDNRKRLDYRNRWARTIL